MDVDPTGRQFPIYRTFVLNAGERSHLLKERDGIGTNQLSRTLSSSQPATPNLAATHDDDNQDGGQANDRHADANRRLGDVVTIRAGTVDRRQLWHDANYRRRATPGLLPGNGGAGIGPTGTRTK